MLITPNKAIEEINNIIQNFIWDGSHSKISHKTLVQQNDNGGLKLCHFETKVKALKLSWIERQVSEKDSTWKILPKLFYSCHNSLKKEPENLIRINNKHIYYKHYKKQGMSSLAEQPKYKET